MPNANPVGQSVQSLPDAPQPTTPSSTKSARSEEKRAKVALPKLPSNDSLNLSPGPSSPGADKAEPAYDRSPDAANAAKLTRKESYKAQRKNYRKEKKRVTNELLNSLKDPSVVVLTDWLKIRGTLKSWTKLWCVLKPGLLLLYKTPKAKSSHWVGTILLNACKVIERPSKKDGFCFKLYNPLDQTIWAPRGPENETIGAVVQPLPGSYSIFRAPSQASGMCWLDALEISIRNDAALVRSVSGRSASGSATHETQWSEADCERHFVHDLDDGQPENGAQLSAGDCELSESESEEEARDEEEEEEEEPEETPYVAAKEEEFGGAGAQVVELADEHKSLIWYLVKQVRPGMDLSKVVLPTFILEPRSFLDKLTDSYYHVDILSAAVLEDDAFTRMKMVVKWYLSGLYKKPKGLKKPYNPILGETFRCYWSHPNNSKTFYLAEQVSHHPPVSAFYVTNRQDGYSINATILARSKFFGNSTSAMLDGTAVLTLLPRGEDYTMTIPYAHCKGILMGPLTMELGGKITIDCEKTGYSTEIEFRLKPLFGGTELTNQINGRLKLGKETLATLDGHWDGAIHITASRARDRQLLWSPAPGERLTRHTVPADRQAPFESERLWRGVSAALERDDMAAATEEKTALEAAQRARCADRLARGAQWAPAHFQRDALGRWAYRHADLRPWDPRNDLYQYESAYEIRTRTRHPGPKRASSDADGNESATTSEEFHSDSTRSAPKATLAATNSSIMLAIHDLEQNLRDQSEKIAKIQKDVTQVLNTKTQPQNTPSYGEIFIVLFVLGLLQALYVYFSSSSS